MFSLFVCVLFALMASTGESKGLVTVQGKKKFTVESVETNCDHNYVEYFHKVPNQEELHTFRVVKVAPKFTVAIMLRNVKSQHILYQLKNMDGCQFLNNPLISRTFNGVYRTIIVNNTMFKCPIRPKVYYLRNMAKGFLAPPIHPPGYYEAIVQIRMAESHSPFVMEMIWKYYVEQIK